MRRLPRSGLTPWERLDGTRRRRARRFAVLLQYARRREQWLVLRRLLGPSSWRCQPHAGPHPGRERAE